MATLEQQIEEVQNEINEIKDNISTVEELIATHPQRVPELDKQLTYLRQKENLLREEKNLLLRERGAGSRITRQAVMSEEGLLLASKYTGFIEMADKQSGHTYRTAAVVCSSRHLATYQHGDHQQLKLGDQVQVCLPATHKVIPTQVVLVDSQNLDCIILTVQGKERLDAPELRPGERGEAYALLGQSCKKHPGSIGTYGHGHIASARANKRGHILGDTLTGKGDSGAGVFSLDGGCLLGMCVGRDAKYQKTVIIPAYKLQDLLTSLQLSEDELSDMDLEPNPTYDSD